MITINIIRRVEGVELLADGHADFRPRGEDIVCAGVSALLLGCLAYLRGVLRDSPAGGADQMSGVADVPSQTDVLTPVPAIPLASAPGSRPPMLEVRDGDGHLWFRTSGYPDRVDRVAIETVTAGLLLIAEAYPSHVTVRQGSICVDHVER